MRGKGSLKQWAKFDVSVGGLNEIALVCCSCFFSRRAVAGIKANYSVFALFPQFLSSLILLSFCMSVFMSSCLSAFLFLSLSLSLFLSHSFSLSLFLYISLSLFLTFSISLFLSLFLYLSLSLSIYVSFYDCFSLSFSIYLSFSHSLLPCIPPLVCTKE
jgi:hypothetical protein